MNIYVGNLPFSATEDTIRDLFTPHGSVNGVTIITDRQTGKPRGFAFVEMPSRTEALAAIKGVDGVEIGERSLIVNEAKPRQASSPRGGSSRGW